MIDTIFILKSARQRQKEAPLLCERELFLSHLLQQGCDRKQVRSVATLLLHVIRIMELQILREIHPEEIIAASERWVTDDMAHTTRSVGFHSAKTFSSIATRWFRFHRVLILPSFEKRPYEEMLNQFLDAMRNLRGLTPGTLTNYRINVSRFLEWCTDRDLSLLSVSPNHIDQFVDEMRAKGWSAGTVVTHCNALRGFFRYAEESGWCRPRICQGILTPRTSKHSACPRGPSWKDVRRLLNYRFGTRPTDLRVEAILCLCSIYGLRSCEIVALRLDDFDWLNETVVVRRAKGGRVQQFPIQYELGEKILRYLKEGRPQCACRNVFVTAQTPHRPMLTNNVCAIVGRRMRELEITAKRPGPHSLRHACATELLRKGSSLKNIADFLGHRGMKSVSIYARYDSRLLRKVCAFSLAGVR